MRLSFSITLLISCSFLLSGCGESKEERFARSQLSTVLQRNQSVDSDYIDWIKNSEARHDTWQNVFDKYDKAVAEKESIQKDLSAVLIPGRFECLARILRHNLARDIEMLQARRNRYNQMFRASVALDQAQEYHNEGMASEYSYDMYFDMASKQRKEAEEATLAAKSFGQAADNAAITSMVLAESLKSEVQALKLLPLITPIEYPVFSSTGDSIVRGQPLATRPCSTR